MRSVASPTGASADTEVSLGRWERRHGSRIGATAVPIAYGAHSNATAACERRADPGDENRPRLRSLGDRRTRDPSRIPRKPTAQNRRITFSTLPRDRYDPVSLGARTARGQGAKFGFSRRGGWGQGNFDPVYFSRETIFSRGPAVGSEISLPSFFWPEMGPIPRVCRGSRDVVP